MIFVRDADCDDIGHQRSEGIYLLVSDRYDFEMVIVEGRIFSRIFAEFLKEKASSTLVESAFAAIVDATAWIGALRAYSHQNGLNLFFDGVDFKFVDKRTLEVDQNEMIRLIFARSKVKLDNRDKVIESLKRLRQNKLSIRNLCCGKYFLEVMSICLCIQYNACDYREGASITLGRILRIATTIDDIRSMSLFPLLRNAVSEAVAVQFTWAGVDLSN
jgi:hypothetical protein